MKKILAMILAFTLSLSLAACSNTQEPSSQAASTTSNEEDGAMQQNQSNLLIAYAPAEEGDAVAKAAALLRETVRGEMFLIEEGAHGDFSSYEFVLLGFAAENSALPKTVQDFLSDNDFGARTIYPFVAGANNDSSAVFFAISQLQPGALLGLSLIHIFS